ncbi:DapH/DapD/GlmU-related protein [Patulibacter sp.]|uniref:acyltransferase n=1 Tax=Patulibacter sp. TaxID=1912859 RepID=UPI0027239C88|nr:DapH/DapD/GlmU-related protein [Patulibacter sp.]MDO9410799.1 DapH/DapD/GlmU-related protein [Patulibacter sp.]
MATDSTPARPVGGHEDPPSGADDAPGPGPAPDIRRPPAPARGGLLHLLRHAREHRMLHWRYGVLFARALRIKLKYRDRVQFDGPAFICPGVHFEIGPNAVVRLGRWSWIGDDTKIRCHEGVIELGAKSVIGQECTLSTYERISIGRECIVADRSMFIDFDHSVAWTDAPIRVQGIYTRPVTIGHNVWIGYGAAVLRGATVGDNAVVGTYAVVTKDVPTNAVAAGAPARVVRMRDAPTRMVWADPHDVPLPDADRRRLLREDAKRWNKPVPAEALEPEDRP